MKAVAIALALCLSLLLSAAACVVAAASLQAQAPDDGPVRISGMGNSGNTFYVSAARRSARQANELGVAPKVSDEVLEQTVRSLIARAHQGDAEAAAFVFELAAAQPAAPPK